MYNQRTDNRTRDGEMDALLKRARELYKISTPVVLENIFITLMGIISTVMVASVGRHAISAVGMIDSVSNLIIAFFSALTTGGTIVVAQYCGRGDRENACRAGAQAIVISFFLSFAVLFVLALFRESVIDFLYGRAEDEVIRGANLFMLVVNFSYPPLAVLQTVFGILRGSGDTGTPMKISIMMNVINVLIGRVLISGALFFPALGVAGAAWGLFISRLAGLAVAAFYIARKSETIRINRPSYFTPDFKIQKVILRFGVPTSVESGLFQVGKMITQIFIVSMGTAALVANSVGNAVFNFINVPGSAFSTAVMILVGQRIGRGESGDVKKTILFSVFAGSAMLGALCLACFPLTGFIIGMYRADAEAAVMIRQLFYTSFLMTPLFWSVSFIVPSGLRAAGDVKFTMVISVATMFAVRICVGYALGVWTGLGVLGVWIGMYADWAVRGAVYCVRLGGDKWKGRGIA